MANFKVGDEVVCISAMSVTNPNHISLVGLKAGVKYRVSWMNSQCVEVAGHPYPHYPNSLKCRRCGEVSNGGWHHVHWRFIKLDGLKEDERQSEPLMAEQ